MHRVVGLTTYNPCNESKTVPSSESVEASEEESDFEGFEPNDGEMSSTGKYFSDGIGSSDKEPSYICSCRGRTHKRDCPLNPRNKAATHKKTYAKKRLTVAVSKKGKGKAVAKKSSFGVLYPPRWKRLFAGHSDAPAHKVVL